MKTHRYSSVYAFLIVLSALQSFGQEELPVVKEINSLNAKWSTVTSKEDSIDLYNKLARLHFEFAQMDSAKYYSKKSESLLSSLSYHYSKGWGYVNHHKGRFGHIKSWDKALPWYKLSLKQAKLSKDNELLGLAYNVYGLAHKNAQCTDEAFAYLDTAAHYYKKIDDLYGVTTVIQNRSNIYYTFQDRPNQEKEIFGMLELIKHSQSYKLWGKFYHALGILENAKGNDGKSLFYLYLAKENYSVYYGDQHSMPAWMSSEISRVNSEHGQFNEADIEFKNFAKNFCQRFGVCPSHYFSRKHYIADRINPSQPIFSFFWRIFYTDATAFDFYRFENILDLIQRENWPEVIEQAERLQLTNNKIMFEALGHAHLQTRDYSQAVTYFDKRLKKISPSRVLDQLTMVNCQLGKAKSYLRWYNKERNIENLVNAAKSFQEYIYLIRTYDNDLFNKGQLDENLVSAIQCYYMLYESTKDEKYIDMASQINNYRKAYLLRNEHLKSRSVDGDTRLVADRNEMQSKIDELKNRLESTELSLIDRNHVLAELALTSKQLNDLTSKNLSRLKLVEQFQSYELPALLSQNQTVLDFVDSDSAYYAIVYGSNQKHFVKFSKVGVKTEIDAFDEAIQNEQKQQYMAIGHSLYKRVFEPVPIPHNTDRLAVMPDGDLWNINFELLLKSTDGSDYYDLDYLLNEYSFSYYYSLGQFATTKLWKKNNSRVPRVLGFSFDSKREDLLVSNMDASVYRDNVLNELPGSGIELNSIANLISGDYYYGSKAKKEIFKDQASKYEVLHLAMHAEVDNDNPLESKLLFPSGNVKSGHEALYLSELYNMTLTADLAILTACNSGAGKTVPGKGLISLGRGFHHAGVNSLLLSKWKVADVVPPFLMPRFYEEILDGKPKDVALREAKLKYLKQAGDQISSPIFWGSFYLVGDSESMVSAKKSSVWVISFVIGFCIFAMFFISYVRTNKGKKARHQV